MAEVSAGSLIAVGRPDSASQRRLATLGLCVAYWPLRRQGKAAVGQNRWCRGSERGRAVQVALGDLSVVGVGLRCVDDLKAIEQELDVGRERK